MSILQIENISKRFGSHQILKELSLEVPEHTIYGFIGQNGAGKTTTMKMILGLNHIDSGRIFVNGEQVTFGQTRTNRFIGYLPDVPEFYSFMTPCEYLNLCGEITGMTRTERKKQITELIELVGLEKADKRIQGFSRGMKQRLGIAQALLNQPKLLICDGIGLLHNGRLAMQASMKEIRRMHNRDGFLIDFVHAADVKCFTDKFGEICASPEISGKTRLIYHNAGAEVMHQAMQNMIACGICPQRMEMLEPSLENIFMEVAQQ